MARHVFQYEHMDTQLGLYLADPSALPPLRPTAEQQGAASNSTPGADRIPVHVSNGSSSALTTGIHSVYSGVFERPARADRAGLTLEETDRSNTGAAHRQAALEQRQREELLRDSAVPAQAEYASARAPTPSAPVAEARVVR